CQQHNTYPPSF
nr:immunoglobulin light chain junction region [Macaca mulatta]MOW09122.1 immunoglobulin light chain junction region [Macaca mulatta]MOW09892.1 immunoglobulin light chain junction region [Macaca mulatta]MOW14327.1 immunoglobulin light chain junction region [Macaca mulatta]MOW14370.1 immunoglobulin light chain junction region [Macaca mulatta]